MGARVERPELVEAPLAGQSRGQGHSPQLVVVEDDELSAAREADVELKGDAEGGCLAKGRHRVLGREPCGAPMAHRRDLGEEMGGRPRPVDTAAD